MDVVNKLQPRYDGMRGWVEPTAGLGTLEKRHLSVGSRTTIPLTPGPILVSKLSESFRFQQNPVPNLKTQNERHFRTGKLNTVLVVRVCRSGTAAPWRCTSMYGALQRPPTHVWIPNSKIRDFSTQADTGFAIHMNIHAFNFQTSINTYRTARCQSPSVTDTEVWNLIWESQFR
jgi:hypothetical protein